MPGMLREVSAALMILIFSAGCGECVTSEYGDFREVLAEKAMERGWIPPILPRSASEIEEQHDIDTNEISIRFRLPPTDVESFVSVLEENGFAAQDDWPAPDPVCGPWRRDHDPAMDEAMAYSGQHVMGPPGRSSIWQRGDTIDVVIEPATGFVYYVTRRRILAIWLDSNDRIVRDNRADAPMIRRRSQE